MANSGASAGRSFLEHFFVRQRFTDFLTDFLVPFGRAANIIAAALLSCVEVRVGIRTKCPHITMTGRVLSCAGPPRRPVMSAFNRHPINELVLPKQGYNQSQHDSLGLHRRNWATVPDSSHISDRIRSKKGVTERATLSCGRLRRSFSSREPSPG